MSRHRRPRVWRSPWPWQQLKPGTKRISRDEYIELLEANVKVLRHEVEIAGYDAEIAGLAAANRAHELLAARGETGRVGGLVDVVPVTADGALHEPAFVALVEARVWEQREQELAGWSATSRGGA